MLKHRAMIAASLLGLVAPALVVTATGAAADNSTTCKVFFDVNHDHNPHDDVAIGTPGEDVQKHENAGTVTIVYGDADGTLGASGGRSISMLDLGFTLGVKDRFGAAVLTADLNGDGCGDLVIGAPGRNSGAGVVIVVYGAPTGRKFGSLVQVLKQGYHGTPGASEAGDGFGSSLAVTGSDPVTGAPTRLWVGAPGEDIGAAKDAGMVNVYPTSPGHILPSTGITSRYQGKDGVGSKPESGDRFGAALAGSPTSVLVGTPGEDIGKHKDAGMFHAFVGGHPSTYYAESAGVPGSSETGDQLGSTLAIIDSCVPGKEAWVIGAPMENVGSVVDAGNALLMDRGTGTAITLQQGADAIGGSPNAGDRFGAALSGSALNAHGTTNRPKAYLAIGVPHEDVGTVVNSGQVTTLTTTCPGNVLAATSVTDWTQAPPDVPGNPATNNYFGSSLGSALVLEGVPATGSLHYRLLIGAPGQDESTTNGTLVNSGVVTALPEVAGEYTATGSTLFGQSTDGIPGTGETNDAFGSSLDSANASR